MVKKSRNEFKIIIVLLFVVLFSCNDEPDNYISIAGLWRLEEIKENESVIYTVDIYKSESDSTIFLIHNFYNIGNEEKIFIKLNTNNKISIETQFIGSTGISVEGSGSADNDYRNITLEYTINDNIKLIDVSAFLTRL